MLAVEAEVAPRLHQEPPLQSTRGPAICRRAARHAGPDREPSRGHTKTERVAQATAELLDEDLPTLGVDLLHLADVRGELAVLNQVRQRSLAHVIPLSVQEEARLSHTRDDLCARHDVADAEPGGEHLAQGAHVDDDARRIGAGERQDGTAVEMVLVIVVVLDHREASLRRQGQQREAARCAQGGRRRVLVVRGRVDGGDAARGGEALELGDDQAVLVDGDRDELRARQTKALPGRFVTARLDGDQRSRARDRSGRQMEPELAAPGDEHLSCSGDDPAGRGEIRRQRLEQTRLPELALVVEGERDVLHRVPVGAAPQVAGEPPHVRQPAEERELRRREPSV